MNNDLAMLKRLRHELSKAVIKTTMRGDAQAALRLTARLLDTQREIDYKEGKR